MISGLQRGRAYRLPGLRRYTQTRRLRVQCSPGPDLSGQIQQVLERCGTAQRLNARGLI